jgi:large subunit ribosomal protein L6
MSRMIRKPLHIPTGVKCLIQERTVQIQGKLGSFLYQLHDAIEVTVENNQIWVTPTQVVHSMLGTTYQLLANMLKGVSEGFERKLSLVGVGYRAKIQGNILELSLGYSNPVNFPVPMGVTIETPSNTEIVIKGFDKQLVGETAAQIRAKRPPECYKGKGVRYSHEQIELKATKKKK